MALKKHNAQAGRTAVLYLIVSVAWITYSDSLLSALDGSPELEHKFATYKAVGFVFVTAVMLFLVIRRHIVHASTARQEMLTSQQDLIRHLAQAAEWRDDETGEHVLRVSAFAFAIAKAYGLSEERCEIVRLAATTHDVGKIGVPDRVVLFTGKYDAEQRAQMQAHTLIGEQILGGGSGELVETARRIAASHHERWDGSGYPEGLAGEEIPLEARITAVADVFDALVSPRRYKEAWTWDASVSAILRGAGTQFDPAVVAAFIRARDAIRQTLESFAAAQSPEAATVALRLAA